MSAAAAAAGISWRPSTRLCSTLSLLIFSFLRFDDDSNISDRQESRKRFFVDKTFDFSFTPDRWGLDNTVGVSLCVNQSAH